MTDASTSWGSFWSYLDKCWIAKHFLQLNLSKRGVLIFVLANSTSSIPEPSSPHRHLGRTTLFSFPFDRTLCLHTSPTPSGAAVFYHTISTNITSPTMQYASHFKSCLKKDIYIYIYNYFWDRHNRLYMIYSIESVTVIYLFLFQ